MASSSSGAGAVRESINNQMEVLTERFKGGVVVTVKEEAWLKAAQVLSTAVVMKLSAPRNFKLHEFINTMKKPWKLEDEKGEATFTAKEVVNGIMVVQFPDERAMERVIDEGPWSFRRTTVLMARWQRGCNPEKMQFTKMSVWVQVHNLPYELRNLEYAKGFAGQAGRVIKGMDPESDKQMFLRVRIEMDITQPPVECLI